MALLLFLAACGSDHGNVDGTYASTRTVTQSDPSPAFVVPAMLSITISNGDVTTSTGTGVVDVIEHHSDDAVHFTFRDSESWTSPEGDGAVTLTYALELKESGTLTGSIGAHIILDTPTMGSDFDYSLDITGMR